MIKIEHEIVAQLLHSCHHYLNHLNRIFSDTVNFDFGSGILLLELSGVLQMPAMIVCNLLWVNGGSGSKPTLENGSFGAQE